MPSAFMKRIGALVLAAAALAGCAEAVPATGTTTVTAAAVAGPAAKPGETPAPAAEAAPVLTRDADLKGSEHHVSLLEGRLTFKVHAVETPKITTGSTPKGLLYSTLEAKLGDGQTVHCAAYADVIWPAGLVAADLRGEHDWADDGSEKADVEAKTHSEVTSFDVVNINNTPTLTARAVVRDDAKNIVAQRKIAVLSGSNSTFLCSDRTIGFSSRFGKFAGEAFASSKLDPAPLTPQKTALYKIFDVDGKTVIGYRQVATFLDKGLTKTFSDEGRLVWSPSSNGGSMIMGEDSLTSSVATARGDETEIHYDAAVDGVAVESSSVTKDGKGFKLAGRAGEPGSKMKNAPLDMFGPAWMTRVKNVASSKATGKKATAASKVSLFTPKAAVAATMTRTGDNSVSIVAPNGETPVALDNDGIVSMTLAGHQYKRFAVTGQ